MAQQQLSHTGHPESPVAAGSKKLYVAGVPIWRRRAEDSWRAAGLQYLLEFQHLWIPVSVKRCLGPRTDGLASENEGKQAHKQVSFCRVHSSGLLLGVAHIQGGSSCFK